MGLASQEAQVTAALRSPLCAPRGLCTCGWFPGCCSPIVWSASLRCACCSDPLRLHTADILRCAIACAKGSVHVCLAPFDRLQISAVWPAELVQVVRRRALTSDAYAQARQQAKEMVWMKQSENMVLEAMAHLSAVHDVLEEMLLGPGGGPAPSSPMASSETEMNRRESEALQVWLFAYRAACFGAVSTH